MEYWEAFADLRAVDLTESWVLEIVPSSAGVAFLMDVVLTPDHPDYRAPRTGEQHCYRRGWMVVHSEDAELALSGNRPAIDANGELDLGQIDAFGPADRDGSWVLDGSWGRLEVQHPTVVLTFEPS
ncbi:hypothetical protein [Aeromicrobium massiliense]|uniref:hypothetical protein n=1 Tax=Aeromicrobium massiliense TaxID=1464554 RepID=UPI0002F4CC5C|nr:hypothetical protein [Aeromicrobium massiliense]